MTAREKIYLLTDFEEDLPQADIDRAIREVSTILEDPTSLSYLLDNKSRTVKFSKGLHNLADSVGVDLTKRLGKNVTEILFDDSLGINVAFDKEGIRNHGRHVLAVIKQEKHFLLNDPWWKELLDRILKHPLAKEIWDELDKNEIDIMSKESRTVNFFLQGKLVPLVYYYTMLYTDPRFMLIEFRGK